ncbi:MAG: complex I subunit 1/NuoH family protein [Candidatus Hodarchaeales archaeon]
MAEDNILTFLANLIIWLVDVILPGFLPSLGIDKPLIILVLYSLVWFIFVLLSIVMLIWLERKAMGRFMDRRSTKTGPLPYGILQNIADFFKLLGKEILFPRGSDRLAILIALLVIIVTGVAAFMVIPFTGQLFVADPQMGFLLIFAIFSLYPIAVAIIGWTSNNKYTLLGGFRSAAQLVSYEIPLVLSLAGAVLIVNAGKEVAERTFSLRAIVEYQANTPLTFLPFPAWFTILLPIGALIFTVTTIAEAERVPFDLPEGESELVMGWRTELTAILYMFAMLGEYLHMFMGATLTVLIFFGGWTMPFGLDTIIPPSIWFTIKVFLMLFVEIWIRGALPRIRIDQLLNFSWKFLVPLSVVNLLLAAFIATDQLVGYILTLVVLAILIVRYIFFGKPKEIPETYATADHKKKPKTAEQGVKS